AGTHEHGSPGNSHVGVQGFEQIELGVDVLLLSKCKGLECVFVKGVLRDQDSEVVVIERHYTEDLLGGVLDITDEATIYLMIDRDRVGFLFDSLGGPICESCRVSGHNRLLTLGIDYNDVFILCCLLILHQIPRPIRLGDLYVIEHCGKTYTDICDRAEVHGKRFVGIVYEVITYGNLLTAYRSPENQFRTGDDCLLFGRQRLENSLTRNPGQTELAALCCFVKDFGPEHVLIPEWFVYL